MSEESVREYHDFVRCIVCGHKMEWGENGEGAYGGGSAYISFHYGSRHDQFGEAPPEPTDPKPTNTEDLIAYLRRCSIEAFICDYCFVAKAHLCRGWITRKTGKRHEQIILIEPKRA